MYRATQWAPVCPQSGHFHESSRGDFMTHRMSEDCLYLNVWSPVVDDSQTMVSRESIDNSRPSGGGQISSKLVPVLFFIHGGGFTAGSASQDTYNATILSAKGNVVVVTINYRLGALGLLYTGCGTAPGNAAFYDQLLALEWVNDNIAYFGGDPSRITIIGESAGSSFVGLHLLSGYSRYLFKNAIMMSGSPLSVIGMSSSKVALRKSKNLAKLVGCPLKEVTETVDANEANGDAVETPDGGANDKNPIGGDKVPIDSVPVLPLPSSTSAPSDPEEVITDSPIMKQSEGVKSPEEMIEESLVKIAEDSLKQIQVKRDIFTEETFKCLMDADIKKILTAQLDSRLFQGLHSLLPSERRLLLNDIPFLPIYGTEILPESPLVTFTSGSYSKNTSLLIGTTEDEGSLGLLLSGVIKKNNRLMSNLKKETASEYLVRYATEYGLKETAPEDIVNFYLGHINASDPEYRMYHLVRAFSDALGDSAIYCPSQSFASHFASTGNCNQVHNYYVSYKSKSPGIKEKAPWCSNDWMGTCHWTDLIYLFALPFRTESYEKFSDLDRVMSEEMIKTFTDFARSGSKGILWPRVQPMATKADDHKRKSADSKDGKSADSKDGKSADSRGAKFHHQTGHRSKVIPFVYELNPLTPSCSKVKRSIRYDACDILWEGEFE